MDYSPISILAIFCTLLKFSLEEVTYEDIQRDRENVIETLLKANPLIQRSHFSLLQPKGSRVVNVTEEESMLETIVLIHFTIARIENIDAETQTMTFSAFGVLAWYDGSLIWNRTNGLYGFEMDQKTVWTPGLVEESTLEAESMDNKILLNHTGIIMQLILKRYTIPCSVDILGFPFDSHVCHFNMSVPFPWLRRIKLVEFPTDSEEFYHTLEHKQWKLANLTSSIVADVLYSLRIEVQRKATFFSVVLLLPSAFLNIMSIAAFLLPSEDSGRVDFSVNVMLSHYIFLLIMMDSLPPSGGTVPLLGIYILGSNGIVVFIVLSNLLIIRLAMYKDEQRELPRLLKCQFWLGRIQNNRRKKTTSKSKGIRNQVEVNTESSQNEGDEVPLNERVAIDEIINCITKITVIVTLTSHVFLPLGLSIYWRIHNNI